MQYKNMLSLRFAFICAAGLLLFSCNSNSNKKEQATQTKDSTAVSSATATADTTAQDEDEDMGPSYILPSPLQIASIFKNSGLTYVDGLTNPTSNMPHYSSKVSQSINLGVYTADLSYCVLNKQNQPAIDYMNASIKLADQLGMGSVFDINTLSTRFKKNMDNEDSLIAIISDLQMNSDTYLQDNQQQYIGAIVFSGAWIESMYIGSKVNAKKSNKDINTKISEQMSILNNVINVLKKYQTKKPMMASVVKAMSSVQDAYNNLGSVKNNKSTEDENGVINLTSEEVQSIAKQIQTVRAQFITGNM